MADITIQTNEGPIFGHLREPAGADPAPGVVVLHEAFGINDDIRNYCQRFASEGYLALAPDLLSRGSKLRCMLQVFRALSRGEGQAFQDIEAARQFLSKHPRCSGTVGVIGFCMGGGFALLLAPRGLFDAAAVNYGRVPKDAQSLLSGSCPLVGSYGGRDRQLRGHAQRLDQALTALDVPHDVVEYPDASHSFMNQHTGLWQALGRISGIGYHEASADDAWRRVLAWFDQYLHPQESP